VVLSSFNFFVVDSETRIFSATQCVLAVQGRWRSLEGAASRRQGGQGAGRGCRPLPAKIFWGGGTAPSPDPSPPRGGVWRWAAVPAPCPPRCAHLPGSGDGAVLPRQKFFDYLMLKWRILMHISDILTYLF